ncbi:MULTISPECIES: glutaredoxin domain-containing protein [Corynebacterium]|uniref:NrdH-redoxin n=1 Tax=Corynebacterium aurimucosum TaxID=169292 RepID=A0A2N6TQI8_9CORY|nr:MULTISPECIES: glutaredoxin domain-containing protein [Corynebacterium]MTD91250.1 NrdH-redoxin [Corynebacterium aurimucosum]MTE10437.1 NrdH-redoxin [Corynebacterium guaraldiae]OFK69012.1 NrdH-redoxin [Corynebacterium sp. HMSC076G08]OFN33746.1 NrdH-redoxin [Corynebacterium sp. HMSC072A04]OFN78094.1 NrdH-redoxin [Corynebacterium sp. HMSC070E08]
MATTPETTEHVTIFFADWCPFCVKLIKNLDRTETPYELVDVEGENTDDINAWIESVNDGNRIVPTVLYSDGTHATNPSASEVRAKYAELAGE